MAPFEELLKASVANHGHLCAGQVIGVRMAMLGCRLVGIDDPLAPQHRKKLIVYVEIDRCATDAIQSVTGCRLGKRTLKFKDFGINAATFVNLETRAAYRIISLESSRETCERYAPNQSDPQQRQLEGYTKMPDGELFDIQKVEVDLPDLDLPGPPRRHAECYRCGQMVRDGKERTINNQTLCRACAGEGYYHIVDNQPSHAGPGYMQKEMLS
jgi:formylmethanofuran dehydrogenase subunit E